MPALHNFPYFEVQFDKNGKAAVPNERTTLLDFVRQGAVTDLFVVSHGWNNDMGEARNLYDRLFKCVRDVLDSGAVAGLAGRSYAILAVLWPSKKFADEELIPSGAAGARSAITTAHVMKQLDDLKGAFDSPNADRVLAEAKGLVPQLENSPAAQKRFGELIRSLLPPRLTEEVDGASAFLTISGDELIKRLSKPVPIPAPTTAPGSGGATRIGGPTPGASGGGAAGIGSFFSGVLSGARNLLNLGTYYQMKERAGVVGRDGVNPLLREIRALKPTIRLHLMGHSFGGRLVTAAAVGAENQSAVGVNSLMLLQAAFSHYAFAQNYESNKNGFFRRLVADRMVSGPVLITCTPNDRAVGLAYPLASLMAGQVAAALGDKNSKYGGIGRNGAQKTPEAIDGKLQAVGTTYGFAAGKFHNLSADKFIFGHSDICKNEVAYAALNALAST